MKRHASAGVAAYRPPPRSWFIVVSVLSVSAIAGYDAVTPPPLVLFGALAVGPCLAAVSASGRVVAAIGAYSLALVSWLSWVHRLWGSQQQVLYLVVTGLVTVISVVAAHRRHSLERLVTQGHADRETLAAVVESSNDAIVVKSLDGTITAWNPSAERMYGYRADEVIGHSIATIMPPAEAARLPELLGRVARGQKVEHYETQRVCKDGSLRDVSVSLSPVRDRTGRVVGVSGIAMDIGARKHAEAQQRQLQERSAQSERLESLGQLAGGIAHDFNNLLAVIMNYAEFLAEPLAGDQDAQADLNRIRAAAERARTLTRQLMVFARREPSQVEAVDVTGLIADARHLLARVIGEHIELITPPPHGPLIVEADRGQLEQVLINVVLNARDAMPDGGAIVIEASAVEVDVDHGSLPPPLQPGHYVRLLVSDTGVGMSREVAARAFEPFFTTKPKDKGVGLGLATVYGIVNAAGGNIKIYSEPNVGTTIRMYLPTAHQPTRAAASPVRTPARGRGQHILVVEDEDAVRDLVVRILDRNGYTVTATDRGRLALSLTEQHSYDLLLTDVIMPEMSGRDLAEQLRQRHTGLPVLFMSGYSDGLLSTQHLLDDTADLIQKPFTANDLLLKVEHALTSPDRPAASARPHRHA